jgi:alpha-ketoglutarate-dependent taurine dioxygenase
VRWRWSAGDVAMRDNRATRHSAVDDYDDKPRILRRVAVTAIYQPLLMVNVVSCAKRL